MSIINKIKAAFISDKRLKQEVFDGIMEYYRKEALGHKATPEEKVAIKKLEDYVDSWDKEGKKK